MPSEDRGDGRSNEEPVGPSLPGPLRVSAAMWSIAGHAARQAARQVPGVNATERELEKVQRAALRELKHRLDDVDDSADLPLAAPADEPEDATSPAEILAGLLQDSTLQTGPQARARLYRWLLQQLLPDQARILAALSDGSSYPLVHVAQRGPMGGTGDRVLENASTVGRSAGVAATEHVPLLISHLRSLGLVEEGPEDESQRDVYDIVETDAPVRSALERMDGEPARMIRRTLRMSPLGQELWAACQTSITDES